MRSQAFIQRSRLLLKASTVPLARSLVKPHVARSSARNNPPSRPSVVGKRLSSSSTTPVSANEAQAVESPAGVSEPPSVNASSPPDTPPDEPEKTRRKAKTLPKDPEEPLELPDGLAADILWQPESEPGPSSHALPPPEILEEALYNLQITLHPQTQHRATYPPSIGPLLEPTLALYCPIEGGDYVIDETVREIARRTDSEVLVLDAVQLAAGEWGAFGKAANSLHLPRNPLHFRPSQSSGSGPFAPDEEDDDGETSLTSSLPQMTLTLLSPQSGRSLVSTPVRRSGPPSKVKVFFDTLVNTSSPDKADAERPRPRLVYIRDFPTLAPSSSAWYPPLVSSVRARRRRTAARSSAPISYPVTIIFGMTPALVPPNSAVQPPISHSMQRPITSSTRSYDANWSEDEISDKARERRLRERLRRWEKGESLQEDLPKLSSSADGPTVGENGPGFIIIGGSNPMLAHPNQSGDQENGAEVDSLFFRTSVLVPRTRSLVEERNCRVKRRREINELTIRMGVGAIGGTVDPEAAASGVSRDEVKDAKVMWEDWGNRIEVWPTVRAIADRAVGRAVATTGNAERTLDATPVSWPGIDEAWSAHWASRNSRKAWMKEAAKSEHEDDTQDGPLESGEVDEVVERLKSDPNLDSHERRLLPCIVNAASMPTSFSQVHLPAHTIDAVRTIVSLPLLHPEAFQQGILKEHGMTGCLLFGPPGTGKTLVVRALAKEAGCRMMAISPSDVMDMYVGEGEKLVKAVFSIARRLAPCVVFLDEIDALLGARVSGRETSSTSAHRGVLTEFMQEMDGLRSAKEDGVIVIGATNRPFDLDDAVLRRLPRRLLVDLPGEPEREEILKILLRDETLESCQKKTESFSGSDLKHLCVAAALDAVKENVVVPWSTAAATDSSSATAEDGAVPPPPTTVPRTLHIRHFDKAFKEITPSSSEVLGSLADLRKWNAEFGEGRGNKKRQQVWGKDRFGFTEKGASADGRVVS
ncbi:hypothetical protein FB45DRAFT_912768 [Roridomyces roridus]|uniref:AAA+ ATPase domain-containing protein n=1 Tax=Roridomyces roridus TaxID=1738132 RepID=A0AAD7BWM2_9AGAR|nr:hypothetical protein FB45DRAFT_912768 [Roridomyces roridus]